ncbi:hypothetical protein G6F31_015495 [Rhizopus arrhizus]|nr:hypothetical protein G6F31_015495 [Rhizopus arrhizus]
MIPGKVRYSDGYEMGPGRKQVPKYLAPVDATLQVQPLTRGLHVRGHAGRRAAASQGWRPAGLWRADLASHRGP